MWILLHKSWYPQESHIHTFSLSGVISVTIPALMLKISRSTSSNTLEQSPLHFSSAASLPVNLMIWSVTCFHTLVRYLLPVSNATTPANDLINWRCTWRSTVQKQIHEKSKNAQMGNIMWSEEPHNKAHPQKQRHQIYFTLNYLILLTVSSWCLVIYLYSFSNCYHQLNKKLQKPVTLW